MIFTNFEKRWNNFWFAPFSPKILALFRIGLCTIVFSEVSRNPLVSSFLSGNEARYFANRFYSSYVSFLPPPPYWLFLAAARLLFVFAFAGLIGLFTRESLLVTAALFFYLFFLNKFFYLNHFYSLGQALFLCALMPCAEVWSVDAWRKRGRAGRPPETVLSWAARLMQVMVSIIYIGSATSKLYPEWLSGESLKMLYEYRAINPPKIFALIASLPFRWQAWLTIVTEYFLALGLWLPPILLPVLAGGLLFHIYMNSAMGIGQFSFQMFVYYLLFFPYKKKEV